MLCVPSLKAGEGHLLYSMDVVGNSKTNIIVMGTWNTAINANDAFLDIHQNYFDLYNEGQNPVAVTKQILQEFSEMFDDYKDRNNSLFALALAQWETKSLDHLIYNQVKEIIDSGKDLDLWEELGADEKILKKRKTVLAKFLSQISTEREKPKRRVRPKFEFEKVEIVRLTSPDNKKVFEIGEEFVNKKYAHTGGLMDWGAGGGSVLYFTGQGKHITAKWIDSQTLEVVYDKDIEFSKRDERAYFSGDDIKVIYKMK